MRHLRAHGNWLAPNLGLLDVWTSVAVLHYLTSTAINLQLPLLWVLGIMGLTMWWVPASLWDRQQPWGSPGTFAMMGLPLGALVIFGLMAWADSLLPSPQVYPEVKFNRSLLSFLSLGQKVALTVAVVGVLLDLFILGIAFLYHLNQAKTVLDVKSVVAAVASWVGSLVALLRLLPS